MNDPEFSKKLAALCGVYVNDAFGWAHSAHASTAAIVKFVPKAVAGLIMEQDLKYFTMWNQEFSSAVRGDPGRRDGVHLP